MRWKWAKKLTALAVLAPLLIAGGCKPIIAARTDMWVRIGIEREARHLPALQWDDRLANYARSWSVHMANRGQLTHSNIGRLLGPYNYVGENIADGNTSAGALHEAFMRSQGHRDNLLAPGFTNGGVGIACQDGTMWITVEFARPTSAGKAPTAHPTAENPIAAPGGDNIKC